MAENRKNPAFQIRSSLPQFCRFWRRYVKYQPVRASGWEGVLPLIVVDAPQLACLAAKALGDAYWIEGDLGIVYAHQGPVEDARRILQVFTSREASGFQTHVPPELYLALGDREHALSELELAFAEHDPLIVGVGVGPRFIPLRSDPRSQQP